MSRPCKYGSRTPSGKCPKKNSTQIPTPTKITKKQMYLAIDAMPPKAYLDLYKTAAFAKFRRFITNDQELKSTKRKSVLNSIKVNHTKYQYEYILWGKFQSNDGNPAPVINVKNATDRKIVKEYLTPLYKALAKRQKWESMKVTVNAKGVKVTFITDSSAYHLRRLKEDGDEYDPDAWEENVWSYKLDLDENSDTLIDIPTYGYLIPEIVSEKKKKVSK
jgi:hypothetical protein